MIPSNVKKIDHRAFNECENLNSINFENDSKLELIERCAFCQSSIKSISFPPNVVTLANNAFYQCYDLWIIEISENSKMSSLNINAFDDESIEIIMMPFTMKKILEEV